MRERHVVIVGYSGVQVLDITGPHEVFSFAGAAARPSRDGYVVSVVSPGGDDIISESGLVLRACGALPPAPVDTIIVPGGSGVYCARDEGTIVGWLREAAPRARRVASVCTGTFLLAEAGLLAGRRVTTHWSRAQRLAAEYPDVNVDADPVFIRDDPIWTSAGVTAGIDLSLALVEDDLGPDVAQQLARHLVMFLRRPGGQSQFATATWAKPASQPLVKAAQDRVHAAPESDLRVERLAAQVGTSARHLSRLFQDQLGETPARYVERVRVERARAVLETESTGLVAIATECGFGTTETMRQAFLRRVGVTPDDYRRRFALHPRSSVQTQET